jgi:RNA recognition motif-containing protein
MSTKLFVGSLPYSTTEEELREIFSEVGEVASARVITDKITGRSRGFGFVEMTNDADANTAIETLNGKDVGGRAIMVSEARPMEKGNR